MSQVSCNQERSLQKSTSSGSLINGTEGMHICFEYFISLKLILLYSCPELDPNKTVGSIYVAYLGTGKGNNK